MINVKCLIKHHVMKTYGQWRYSYTHSERRHYMHVSGITLRLLYPREIIP